jgi:dimethylargininase
MLTKAIVKIPGESMRRGLSRAGLGRPDYPLALVQHRAYVQALEACGLDVIVLQADEALPDSVFVEDTAVLLGDCAVITRPGAPSRRNETSAIEAELVKHIPTIEHIGGRGRLDGGDVMLIDRTLYIGLSARTNQEGADQLARIAEAYAYTPVRVPLRAMLHLKTGVNYLADRRLLLTGEFVDREVFEGFQRIVVSSSEAYAANSLFLNGCVLMPAGFPETHARIDALGYPVLSVDVSEFRKLDGGLSCLSLRM